MFLKQDIDIKMIGMVLLVILGIVALTIFYQSSAGGVASKYKKLAGVYKDLRGDYNETSTSLNECLSREEALNEQLNETESYQKESQKGFNDIFSKTETELEQKKQTLEETQNELAAAKSNLETKNAKINQLEQQVDSLEDKYTTVVNKAEKVINKADNVLADVNSCKNNADANTCITTVHSQYNSLMGDINNLEDAVNAED